MTKHDWYQPSLSDEVIGVSVECKLALMQESAQIGMWLRAVTKPSSQCIAERLFWLNFTENGMAKAVEEFWEFVRQTEGDHGLILQEIEVVRDPAPF